MIFTKMRRLQCSLPMKILVCFMIVSLLTPCAQGPLFNEMNAAYADNGAGPVVGSPSEGGPMSGEDGASDGGSDNEGTTEDSDRTIGDDEGTAEDGEETTEDDEGTAEDGDRTIEDDEGTAEDGEGTTEDGEGTTEDGEGTTEDGEGTEIDPDIVAPDVAEYTVALWMEIPNYAQGDPNAKPTPGIISGYNYVGSVMLNGFAESVVNLDRDGLPDSITALFNGSSDDPTNLLRYAEFQSADSKVIQRNGSTVINLYASRKVYKYWFLLDEQPGRSMTIAGETYYSGAGEPRYRLDVKYEMDISNKFPVYGVNFVSFSEGFSAWYRAIDSDYTSIGSRRNVVDTSMISKNGGQLEYTFTGRWAVPGEEYNYRYLAQAYPDQALTPHNSIVLDGVAYVVMEEFSQIFQGELGQKAINGLNKVSVSGPGGKAWLPYGYSPEEGYTAATEETEDIYRCFFYSRNMYKLTFNGNIPANAQGLVSGVPESRSYMLGQPVGPAPEIAPKLLGYAFTGWYRDADLFEPFDFTMTMPNNNLAAYAGWQSSVVERKTVVVTANSLTAAYNGYERSVGGIKSVEWSDGNPEGAVLSGLSVPVVSRALTGSTGVVFEGTAIITINVVDVTSDYNIVTVDGLLTIKPLIDNRIVVTITANSAEFTYDGTEKSVSGYTVFWSNGNIGRAELSGVSATAVRTELGVTPVNVTGKPVITLGGFDVTAAYYIILEQGTLTVKEEETKLIDVTVTANSAEYYYDGTEKSVEGYTVVWSDGNLYGAELSGLSAGAKRLFPGETWVEIMGVPVVTLNGMDITSRYNIVKVAGILSIREDFSPSTIMVTANSAEYYYDGTGKSASGYTAVWSDGNPLGAELSGIDAEVSRRLPGESLVSIKGAAVVTLDGVDITTNYRIIYVDGTLTVKNRLADELLDVYVTAHSATYFFDGTEKSVEGYTVNWSDGNPAGVVLDGLSAQEALSYPGSIPVEVKGYPLVILDGTDVTVNYNIIRTSGTLTVIGPEAVITVTANSAEYIYDGYPKSVSGYTEQWSDGNLFGAVLSGLGVSEVYRTVPGKTPVVFTGNPKVTINGVDVTSYYTIVLVDGELSILDDPIVCPPFPVVVSANSATFNYDGTEKSVGGYTVMWSDGYTFSDVAPEGFEVVGFNAPEVYRTERGTTPVVFDEIGVITYNGEEYTGDLYNLFVYDGSLTISGLDRPYIIIAPHSYEFAYDGDVKTVGGGYNVLWQGFNSDAELSGIDVPIVERSLPGVTPILVEGTPVITLNGVDITDICDIIIEEGYLQVNKLYGDDRIPIEVTANSGYFAYDGSLKSVGGIMSIIWNNPGGAVLSGLYANEVYRMLPGVTPVTIGGVPVVTLQGVDVTENYDVRTIDGILRIDGYYGGRPVVTVTANHGEFRYDGTEKSVGGYTTEWSDGNQYGAVLTGLSASAVRTAPGYTETNVIGTPVITINGIDVTENYDIITEPSYLHVRALFGDERIVITAAAESAWYEYDGTEKSLSGYSEFWSDGNPGGARLTGISSPVVYRTEPGATILRLAGTGLVTLNGLDVTANYRIVRLDGALNVVKANPVMVRITANSATFDFDGTEKSVSGYTVEWSDGNPDGVELSGISAEASRTMPGYTIVSIMGTPIFTLNGIDVTERYDTVFVDGLLEVGESYNSEILVRVNSGEFKYDGTQKYVSGYTIEAANENIVLSGVTAEAVRTLPGCTVIELTGTPVLTLNGVDVTQNYYLKVVPGELTIDRCEVTITAASARKVYDGRQLTNPAYTVEGLPDNFTASAVVVGMRLFIGTTPNVVESYVIYDSNGLALEDPEEFFIVKCINGFLLIEPEYYT